MDPRFLRVDIIDHTVTPEGIATGVKKTLWLNIVQRKWKKVFGEIVKIRNSRNTPKALKYRELHGRWPEGLDSMPGLKGLLVS